MAASGATEVREDGEWLAELASQDHIVLEVQRFGRTRPGRLEFLRTESQRPAGRVSREQFRARLHHVLAERFPDATIDSLTTFPHLEHSFSGVYVRGRMREGATVWALLAVPPEEGATAVERALSFGILWLHWVRTRNERRGSRD